MTEKPAPSLDAMINEVELTILARRHWLEDAARAKRPSAPAEKIARNEERALIMAHVLTVLRWVKQKKQEKSANDQ